MIHPSIIITKNINAIWHLNPDHTLVVGCDQLLYSTIIKHTVDMDSWTW